MQPDTTEDSTFYGVWPSLVGFAYGAALTVMMFTLATGMQ